MEKHLWEVFVNKETGMKRVITFEKSSKEVVEVLASNKIDSFEGLTYIGTAIY